MHSRTPSAPLDYFRPGLQEIRRFSLRVWNRIELNTAQKKLAKAEAELGLLGWQQADFDGAIQKEVDALQNIEREQAKLENRSAQFANEVSKIGEQREKKRAEYERKKSAIEADRAKVAEPQADLEQQISTLKASLPKFDNRARELEREQEDVDAMYTKMLQVQPQTPNVRDEILRLRDRLIAIPNEKSDAKTQQARSLGEIQSKEKKVDAIEVRLREFDGQLKELKATFEKEDEVLQREEEKLADERKKAGTDGARLERAKANPYRAIGAVLADHAIAPMNQPQALSGVLDLREQVSARQTAIDGSLAQSQRENQSLVRASLLIWAVIFISVILLLATML